MVKNVLAAAILVALSHQACAFDLGGMLKQVQSSMEQAQQSEVQQPEAQQPTATPQTQTQQAAISPAETSSAPKQETYEEKQERIRKFVDDKRKAQSNTTVNKGKWAAHSDEDCAAAKKLLPENIKKLSAIRIKYLDHGSIGYLYKVAMEHGYRHNPRFDNLEKFYKSRKTSYTPGMVSMHAAIKKIPKSANIIHLMGRVHPNIRKGNPQAGDKNLCHPSLICICVEEFHLMQE